MPHMIVKLWPGKSEAPKTLLAEKIAQGGIVRMTGVHDRRQHCRRKPPALKRRITPPPP
jgi:hypothetical protein